MTASPLALIIAKLEWARAGESERQLRDVVGILALTGVASLDVTYIERWAEELGITSLWQKVRLRAEPSD